MQALQFFDGPTGGLKYHWSALCYRQRRWQPFLNDVDHWLNVDWSPRHHELIVFGSSAGWTLSASFIAKFKRLLVIEPDPLARALFRWRFRDMWSRIQLDVVASHQLLPWFSAAPKFEELLSSRPGAAILFSNVLGQVPLLLSEVEKRQIDQNNSRFLAALQSRSWASYHDWLSSPAALRNDQSMDRPRTFSAGTPLETVASVVFEPSSEVTDHQTLWLARENDLQCSVWDLRPSRRHLIAFVKS